MDGYLSNKPDNFVDDPKKLYRLRRREAHQAKKLDFVDSKSEDEGSLKSPKNSPPQSPRENRLPPMEEQPQERKIGCHTRFYKENRMHLICAPGSSYTHMIDNRV
jgi:hypothetical protein